MKKLFLTNKSSVSSTKLKPGLLPVSFAASTLSKHSISDDIFYTWRKKFGGMEVPEVERLKSLEQENASFRKLLAEDMLDKEALQVALGRKLFRQAISGKP